MLNTYHSKIFKFILFYISIQKRPSFAVRSINSIEIVPGKALTVQNDKRLTNTFEYWNIRINAKSFVYRQVNLVSSKISIEFKSNNNAAHPIIAGATNNRNTHCGSRRKTNEKRCI